MIENRKINTRSIKLTTQHKLIQNIMGFMCILFFLVHLPSVTYSQSFSVGINTITPDATAILELNSTAKGFLVPRMNQADRDAIASPATGLLIYQLDGIDGFYYWNGYMWLWIGTSLTGNYVYGTGDPGQVGYWTSSSTITGDDNLFWNSTTNRLGIGTNNPQAALEITGGLRVQNTTNTNEGAIRWTGLDFEGYTGAGGWKSFTKNYLAGDGEAGQVTYWESSTFLAGDDQFYWDNTNARLGLGTTTPRERIEVNGGIRIGNTVATNPGGFRWNPGTSDFEGWNGTQWLSFTTSTLTGSGSATQVTYWNSPSNLTGDNNLYWDESNTFLGLGTTTPREALDIAGGVKVGNTTPSTATVTGAIRWTGDDFEGFDGSSWLSFTKVSGLAGTGTNGQITYWSSTVSLAGDDDNFFDLTNKRHGVRTNTPAYPLEVESSMRIGGDSQSGQLIFYSEQGANDYEVFLKPSSTMSMNTIYTFPVDYGLVNDALTTDGAGNLYWAEPTVALGDFWQLKAAPRDNVLETYQDWGLARYSAVVNGATAAIQKSQVNWGVSSTSNGSSAMIGGGLLNTATGDYSFISGGERNTTNANYTYIFGGSENSVSGLYSTASGYKNTISGSYSIIENGQNLTLSGSRSYAFRGGLTTTPYTLATNETFYILDANFHFNEGNADADFRVDGDNIDYTMFVDASTNKIGFNMDTPSHLLDVKGDIALTNNSGTATALRFQEPNGSGTNYSSFSATSQTVSLIYKLPPVVNDSNSALFNNLYGNADGILEWATPEQVRGYLRATVITVTGDYSVQSNNVYIVIRNEGYKVRMTLPSAASVRGKRFFFKKMSTNAAGNAVNIRASAGETIDGINSPPGVDISAAGSKYGGFMVTSDGSNWYIYSDYGN